MDGGRRSKDIIMWLKMAGQRQTAISNTLCRGAGEEEVQPGKVAMSGG